MRRTTIYRALSIDAQKTLHLLASQTYQWALGTFPLKRPDSDTAVAHHALEAQVAARTSLLDHAQYMRTNWLAWARYSVPLNVATEAHRRVWNVIGINVERVPPNPDVESTS